MKIGSIMHVVATYYLMTVAIKSFGSDYPIIALGIDNRGSEISVVTTQVVFFRQRRWLKCLHIYI